MSHGLDPPRGKTSRASRDPRPHNFPAEPTPLIGRDELIATGRRTLLREDVRLLTLTGPAGSGKTRLALAVARSLLDRFPDGAFLVDLAPVRDPDLVANAIAHVLGVRDTGDRAVADSIRGYLRDRQLLLILDNFEQVLGAAPVASDLLRVCPALKILVTSRAALHLRWEHELPVPPLAVPDLERLPSAAALAKVPAVALFVERAQATRPDFVLTEEIAPAVAETCARLDGLPLAIVLAAARMKALTPRELLARLDRRLQLLTGGSRDQPARHQTLRAALGWSYDLLPPAEQALFRRLGVFVGGWTLDAATAICGDPGDRDEEVLERLSALIDNSLVQRDAAGVDSRFGMLETVRELAAESLAATDEASARRERHVAYFATLAERSEPHLKSAEQLTWLPRLEAELGNFRAALARSLGEIGDRRDPAAALRLAGGLGWFLWMRGPYGEGRRWLESVLAVADRAPAELRARALHAAGMLAFAQHEFAQALRFQEESLDLWEQLGDPWGIAWERGSVGVACGVAQGDRARRAALIEQALAGFRELGDAWHTAWCLWVLALGPRAGTSERQVDAMLDEALRLVREAGDAWGTGCILSAIAGRCTAMGDIDRARSLLDDAAQALQSIADKRTLCQVRLSQSDIAQGQGEFARASAYCVESLALARDIGAQWAIAAPLFRLASIHRQQGDLPRAARLFGAYLAARSRIRLGSIDHLEPAADLDREAASVASDLQGEAAQSALAEGKAMTIDQAIVYATTPPTPDEHGSYAPRSPMPLSPREHEVARLLARGLTNAQIARELVITERTAAAHVEHILAKLGFASRTQVAVWAAGAGRPGTGPIRSHPRRQPAIRLVSLPRAAPGRD